MGRKSRAELPGTIQLLERVAKLYYVSGLSQQEIADQLKIGRSSVARFLKDARDRGIVTIHVGIPSGEDRNFSLEKNLIHAFSLKDAVVVSAAAAGKFGLVGAEYLDTVLPESGYLGVSGGNTIYQIGQFLDVCGTRKELTVVQVTGLSLKVPETTVAHRWASKLDATVSYLPAPILIDNPDTRRRMLEDPSIRTAISHMDRLSIILVGIGSLNPAFTPTRIDTVGELELEKNIPADSVGDIVLHFYDRDGRFCHPELSQRIMGITTQQYLNVPTRIGAAYGPEKTEAIHTALTGKLINVLITDELTAAKLLESGQIS